MEMETDSTKATPGTLPKVSWWKAVFPPAQWVPAYQAEWLRSAGRAFAAKYGYKVDVRQELLGIGSANMSSIDPPASV
jgi:hypothetical protein